MTERLNTGHAADVAANAEVDPVTQAKLIRRGANNVLAIVSAICDERTGELRPATRPDVFASFGGPEAVEIGVDDALEEIDLLAQRITYLRWQLTARRAL